MPLAPLSRRRKVNLLTVLGELVHTHGPAAQHPLQNAGRSCDRTDLDQTELRLTPCSTAFSGRGPTCRFRDDAQLCSAEGIDVLVALENHTDVQAIISVVEKCLNGADLTLALVLAAMILTAAPTASTPGGGFGLLEAAGR
jgi:hypothetical protein